MTYMGRDETIRSAMHTRNIFWPLCVLQPARNTPLYNVDQQDKGTSDSLFQFNQSSVVLVEYRTQHVHRS